MTVATEKDYDRGSLTEEERRSDISADSKFVSPRTHHGTNTHHHGSPVRGGNSNRDNRRMSLLETMVLQNHYDPYTNVKEQFIFNPSSDQLTVGDIVRVQESPTREQEGIVVEKVNASVLLVDFGENVREVALSHCTLLMRSDEFEIGDKVEARPAGSNLYFVGKVIKVNSENKTMDVLMEGDDPDDVEFAVPYENARKLVSRRNMVVNRWKRAFMMVVAANLFKKIHFQHGHGHHHPNHHKLDEDHHNHHKQHSLEAK